VLGLFYRVFLSHIVWGDLSLFREMLLVLVFSTLPFLFPVSRL
jgi:hypothetical protein